jgi:hypothetical protein
MALTIDVGGAEGLLMVRERQTLSSIQRLKSVMGPSKLEIDSLYDAQDCIVGEVVMLAIERKGCAGIWTRPARMLLQDSISNSRVSPKVNVESVPTMKARESL